VSRALVVAVEGATPLALFLLLLWGTAGSDAPAHAALALAMFVAFALLGSAIGFATGFRHEKAVNNFLVSVTWVLGLGPGPFFGARVDGWRAIFPGAHALRGEFALEAAKLAGIAAAAFAILALACRPRRTRFFSR